MSVNVVAFFDARYQSSGPLWEAFGRENHWRRSYGALPQWGTHAAQSYPSHLGAYDLAEPGDAAKVVAAARAIGLAGFVLDLYRVGDLYLSGADRLDPCCDETFGLAFQWDNGARAAGPETAFDWPAHRRDLAALVAAIAPWRSIRAGGHPVLVIKRPHCLLSPSLTVSLLRDEARRAGLSGLYLVANATEATGLLKGAGFDACLDPDPAEWPSCEKAQPNTGLTMLQVMAGTEDPAIMADSMLDYRTFAASRMVGRRTRGKVLPRVLHGFANWPDLPNGGATVLGNVTTRFYKRFLEQAIVYAATELPQDERLVFLDSWNNWRQGSQIEPNTRRGDLLLSETKAALQWAAYLVRTIAPQPRILDAARLARIDRACAMAAQGNGGPDGEKPEQIFCPSCGSPHLRAEQGHSWQIGSTKYTLKACGACGFRFTDPYPSDSMLSAHYTLDFDYNWYQAHYAAKYVDAKRRLLEARPWLGRSVLDYGGGVGYLAEAARRRGHDAVVFDPFRDREAVLAERAWDTIFCMHVLEHSTEPEALLRRLHGLLAADGTLVLAVPNAAGRGYARFGIHWVWFQPPLTHVSHFTPQALSAMAARAGFRIERMSFHDRWDANTVADIDNVDETRFLDQVWGRTRDPEQRKKIAWRNTRYRYRALRACRNASADNSELAEVLLIARKA